MISKVAVLLAHYLTHCSLYSKKLHLQWNYLYTVLQINGLIYNRCSTLPFECTALHLDQLTESRISTISASLMILLMLLHNYCRILGLSFNFSHKNHRNGIGLEWEWWKPNYSLNFPVFKKSPHIVNTMDKDYFEPYCK